MRGHAIFVCKAVFAMKNRLIFIADEIQLSSAAFFTKMTQKIEEQHKNRQHAVTITADWMVKHKKKKLNQKSQTEKLSIFWGWISGIKKFQFIKIIL